ncbi:MAG: hypothetical protein AAB664_03325 [Patescibacteria group bacterium]
MKRSLIYLSVLFHFFVLSVFTVLAAPDAPAKDAGPAALVIGGLDAAAVGTGYNKSLGLSTVIGRGISFLLGAVGMVFVIIVIYGGIMYMTSAGVEDKVKTAKKMITQAIIGIIIIISAYAISSYVLIGLGEAVK